MANAVTPTLWLVEKLLQVYFQPAARQSFRWDQCPPSLTA
jgi:hypothetical protein